MEGRELPWQAAGEGRNRLGPEDLVEAYGLWGGPPDTPFSRIIRSVLVRGTPALLRRLVGDLRATKDSRRGSHRAGLINAYGGDGTQGSSGQG